MTNAQTVRHIFWMMNEGNGSLTKDGERMLRQMTHEYKRTDYAFNYSYNPETKEYSDPTIVTEWTCTIDENF